MSEFNISDTIGPSIKPRERSTQEASSQYNETFRFSGMAFFKGCYDRFIVAASWVHRIALSFFNRNEIAAEATSTEEEKTYHEFYVEAERNCRESLIKNETEASKELVAAEEEMLRTNLAQEEWNAWNQISCAFQELVQGEEEAARTNLMQEQLKARDEISEASKNVLVKVEEEVSRITLVQKEWEAWNEICLEESTSYFLRKYLIRNASIPNNQNIHENKGAHTSTTKAVDVVDVRKLTSNKQWTRWNLKKRELIEHEKAAMNQLLEEEFFARSALWNSRIKIPFSHDV